MSIESKRSKGFTLIELLVAIGVILLILAASIPLFLGRAKDQSVITEGRIVASYIDQARNLAMNPESEDADGYRVNFVDSSGVRIVRLKKNATTGNYQEEPVSLGNNLKLTNSKITSSLSSIDFQVGSGEPVSSGDAQVVVVLNKDQSKVATITVTKSGTVNVN